MHAGTVLDPDLQMDLDLQTQRIEVFPSFHLPMDLNVYADCIFKMLCQLVQPFMRVWAGLTSIHLGEVFAFPHP